MKAFVLVQAYITRTKLPIKDFVSDMSSVVTQFQRVLHAAMEVADSLRLKVLVIRWIQALEGRSWKPLKEHLAWSSTWVAPSQQVVLVEVSKGQLRVDWSVVRFVGSAWVVALDAQSRVVDTKKVGSVRGQVQELLEVTSEVVSVVVLGSKHNVLDVCHVFRK